MAVVTESNYTAEFIIGEPQSISKDTVTLLSGQSVVAGEVLGKVTASGKYKQYDNAGKDGEETAAAISYATVDASAADTDIVVISRLCEVKTTELAWKGDQDANAKTAGLADLAVNHIIAR